MLLARNLEMLLLQNSSDYSSMNYNFQTQTNGYCSILQLNCIQIDKI